jgi:hypothetical protein
MEQKDFRSLIQTNETRSNLVSSIMMEMIISRTQDWLREIAQGLEIVSEEISEGDVIAEATDEPPSETFVDQVTDDTNPLTGNALQEESSTTSEISDTHAPGDQQDILENTEGVESPKFP